MNRPLEESFGLTKQISRQSKILLLKQRVKFSTLNENHLNVKIPDKIGQNFAKKHPFF